MKTADERSNEYRTDRCGVKYLFRGPNLDWGVITLLPGDALGAHKHRKVEETFYFTGGDGVMVVDGDEHPARQGLAYYVEPGEAHDIRNNSNMPLSVVFIKYPYDPEDKEKV